MPRQRTDPDKIEELAQEHLRLKRLFAEGKLEGKIGRHLFWKARDLGISLATYYRRQKETPPHADGGGL